MEQYITNLHKLKENQNYRSLPHKDTLQLLDLCSNDYLGINTNNDLQTAFFQENKETFAFSSCSSRLLSKNLEPHLELEGDIASAYKAEACLLFNSGYHANLGILSAIATNNDLIIADKLVHASIIDGSRLSTAGFMRHKHLDYNHLEVLLKKYRNKYNKVFIVSESIFSMDGDIAGLYQLIELKNKYNCQLYIDEAHALGVRGKNGLGYAEELDCISDIEFIVGTLGKAMASVGAFVVCNQIVKDFLINHSRPFIFSTALPPINIAWSRYIFQELPKMGFQRQKLHKLASQFSAMLNLKATSHIIPFMLGSNTNAVKKSLELKKHGFNILPIRYPTVPQNTARLRFSLNASLNIEQLKPIRTLLLIQE
jgi:8-amino-7-oxononanoate synthase